VESCIFGIRWFSMLKIVFFQESVLRDTLLSVNVDQCECVFGISWFIVAFTDGPEFGAEIEILPFR
jgi:hypothetical protein